MNGSRTMIKRGAAFAASMILQVLLAGALHAASPNAVVKAIVGKSGTTFQEGINDGTQPVPQFQCDSAAHTCTVMPGVGATPDSVVLTLSDPDGAQLTLKQLATLGHVNVEQFRKPGVDDATALQKAITFAAGQNKIVDMPTAGACLTISRKITLPSNTHLDGRGCLRAANGMNDTMVAIAPGAAHVSLTGGLEFDGNKANNAANIGHCIATAAASGGSVTDDILIDAIAVHDCAASGAYLVNVSDVTVSHSRFYSNQNAGLSGSNITGFQFETNFAWLNGYHGIGLAGPGHHGNFVDNTSYNNGQVSPLADNLTGYDKDNDHLKVADNTTWGGGNNCIHFGGKFISYIHNTASGCAKAAIINYAYDYAASQTVQSTDVIMNLNIVDGAGNSGIDCWSCARADISDNVIRQSLYSNINIDAGDTINVHDNTLSASTQHGVDLTAGCNTCKVHDNIVQASGGDGVRYCQLVNSDIHHNTISGSTRYAIESTNCAASGNRFNDNDIRGNVALGTFGGNLADFIEIQRNIGYRRPGSGPITVGASPWTYQVGPSDEVLSYRGQAVTSIVVNGQLIFDATNVVIPVHANDTVVTTYPGAAPNVGRLVY